MLIDHWPLSGLRLRTPRLELRLPSDDQLAALADVAAAGVHEPDRMPFLVPWTDLPPAERARSVVQYHWLRRGDWTPEDWSLTLAVLEDGRVVGQQALYAREFATLREVRTSSWLGTAHQGRGIGTEMRAAVLHLAFAGLAAREAKSGALEGNEASWEVSRKHGYQPDGIDRHVVRGQAVVTRRLRLTRARWDERERRVPVRVEGLAPCLPLFGAGQG
ncbi:GNAT family N-acetyltransferase [Kitasatospora sp. NPDC096147]|uniref:GNAT family N-acetyltransferase n=1 Tax=Kitasatospora sp. NPDC096147 TaxID=3364093 RepID=UPI003813978A